MSSLLITVLLWLAALGSGLMAGVYFAFSAFIMRAFGTIDGGHAVAAMNAINTTILQSSFMPLFFGSTIVSMLLAVAALVYWGEPGAAMALAAGGLYLLGMFVCTAAFNVPLNNSLAAISENDGDAQKVWSHYLKTWTSWNHLRTVCSLVTCAMCVWILSVH